MDAIGDPVFIHIPRSGGNSILRGLEGKNAIVVHHARKEDLSLVSRNWIFAFIRDPVDRVASAYAYLKAGGLSDEDIGDADRYVRCFTGFEEFVYEGLEQAAQEQRHFLPQKYWLTNPQGVVVADFLGRTEHLQDGFDFVCDTIGWDRFALGVLNTSNHEGLACTPKMREVIERVYAEDIELLQESQVRTPRRPRDLVEKILDVFYRNYPLETRDVVWDNCMDIAMKTELNRPNLENMCGTSLVCGFGFVGGSGKKEITKLAQALGICGVSNPENDAYYGCKVLPPANVEHLTTDEVLDAIQTKLPFAIDFPPFNGNCPTVELTKYGVAANQHIFYLWVLKRVLELCPDPSSGILEIGSGFGTLGYYLDRVGYKDYTSVDLALINACQTYSLYKNLPRRKILLSGDVEDPFDLQHQDSIKLLHSTDFHDVPKNRFSIMVNMSGLTEMGVEQASLYMQSDCAPILLSINHEVNPYRVIDIPQDRKLIYRNLFWLRTGYVEELYVSE